LQQRFGIARDADDKRAQKRWARSLSSLCRIEVLRKNPSRESVTTPSRRQNRRARHGVTDLYLHIMRESFSLYLKGFSLLKSVTKTRDGFVTDFFRNSPQVAKTACFVVES
jgi:hypothetical protein